MKLAIIFDWQFGATKMHVLGSRTLLDWTEHSVNDTMRKMTEIVFISSGTKGCDY
jgi:hypothetical protein